MVVMEFRWSKGWSSGGGVRDGVWDRARARADGDGGVWVEQREEAVGRFRDGASGGADSGGGVWVEQRVEQWAS